MPTLARPIPYEVQPSVDGLIPLHAADGQDACLVPNGDDVAAERTAELLASLTRILLRRNDMTTGELRRALNEAAAL